MKDLGKKMALRVLLTLGMIVGINQVSAWAIGDVKVKPVNGSKKAVVAFDNKQGENLHVSVSSESGYVNYFKESVPAHESYAKLYNLEELEDGSYKIVIDSEHETLEKVISIEGYNVAVEKEVKYLKPQFNITNNRLLIDFANLQKEDITVKIHENSYEIFTEDLKNAESIHRTYDISKLPKGEYTVVLTSEAKNYYFEFSK